MSFADRWPETDVSPADWIVSSVGPFGVGVPSLLPPGFEAYARVFHPASLGDEDVRWADVAAANGRVAHPAMEWVALTGSWRYDYGGQQKDVWDEPPEHGSPPPATARVLGRVLAAFTTSAEYWFAVWEGWGSLPRGWASLPARVHMPARDMHLFRGTAADVGEPFEEFPFGRRGAGLWWPADRAWCVASDVDLVSSYVGGSAACIAAVVAAPELEAAQIPYDQRVTFDTDHLNPPPSDRPW